jgi:hypothetical protein
VGEGGLLGSAFEVGLAKSGLVGRADRLRVTLAQPLTAERGTVDLSSVEVTDRDTGAIGVVTRPFDVASTGRRLVGEAMYGAPVLDGRGQVGLFGRGELRRTTADVPEVLIGTRAQLSF